MVANTPSPQQPGVIGLWVQASSAMQEPGKMPLFPLLGQPMITETLLLLTKFGRMDTPAAIYVLTRNQLM
jgi:hypothetical protein